MAFPNWVYLQPGDQFKTRTSAQGPLYPAGTKGIMPNGDIFRYTQCNASTAIVPGKLYQARVPVTNHVLQTAAAAAAGADNIALTLGATAVAANEYLNGIVTIDLATNTGFGYLYHIDAHAAVLSSGVFTIPLAGSSKTAVQSDGLRLSGYETVQVAVATTANSVSIVANTNKLVIISAHATPPDSAEVAGISVGAIATSAWGWLQTHGPVMALTNGTVVIGQAVVPSATTDGAVEAYPAGVAETTPIAVGDVIRVAVTTAYSTINSRID